MTTTSVTAVVDCIREFDRILGKPPFSCTNELKYAADALLGALRTSKLDDLKQVTDVTNTLPIIASSLALGFSASEGGIPAARDVFIRIYECIIVIAGMCKYPLQDLLKQSRQYFSDCDVVVRLHEACSALDLSNVKQLLGVSDSSSSSNTGVQPQESSKTKPPMKKGSTAVTQNSAVTSTLRTPPSTVVTALCDAAFRSSRVELQRLVYQQIDTPAKFTSLVSGDCRAAGVLIAAYWDKLLAVLKPSSLLQCLDDADLMVCKFWIALLEKQQGMSFSEMVKDSSNPFNQIWGSSSQAMERLLMLMSLNRDDVCSRGNEQGALTAMALLAANAIRWKVLLPSRSNGQCVVRNCIKWCNTLTLRNQTTWADAASTVTDCVEGLLPVDDSFRNDSSPNQADSEAEDDTAIAEFRQGVFRLLQAVFTPDKSGTKKSKQDKNSNNKNSAVNTLVDNERNEERFNQLLQWSVRFGDVLIRLWPQQQDHSSCSWILRHRETIESYVSLMDDVVRKFRSLKRTTLISMEKYLCEVLLQCCDIRSGDADVKWVAECVFARVTPLVTTLLENASRDGKLAMLMLHDLPGLDFSNVALQQNISTIVSLLWRQLLQDATLSTTAIANYLTACSHIPATILHASLLAAIQCGVEVGTDVQSAISRLNQCQSSSPADMLFRVATDIYTSICEKNESQHEEAQRRLVEDYSRKMVEDEARRVRVKKEQEELAAKQHVARKKQETISAEAARRIEEAQLESKRAKELRESSAGDRLAEIQANEAKLRHERRAARQAGVLRYRERTTKTRNVVEYLKTLDIPERRVYHIVASLGPTLYTLTSQQLLEYVVVGNTTDLPQDLIEYLAAKQRQSHSNGGTEILDDAAFLVDTVDREAHVSHAFWDIVLDDIEKKQDEHAVEQTEPHSTGSGGEVPFEHQCHSFHFRIAPLLDLFDYDEHVGSDSPALPSLHASQVRALLDEPISKDLMTSVTVPTELGFDDAMHMVHVAQSKQLLQLSQSLLQLTRLGVAYHRDYWDVHRSLSQVIENKRLLAVQRLAACDQEEDLGTSLDSVEAGEDDADVIFDDDGLI